MSNFKTQKLPSSKKPLKKITAKKREATDETTPDNIVPTPKKNHHIKKWIIGGIMTMIALLFVGNMALRALGNISISHMNSGADHAFTPTEVTDSGSIPKLQGTRNILIAGIGGQGHEGSLLTDSLMLASINQDDKKVTLLSIPRDFFIAYPKGYGVAGKINTLYTIGVSNKVGIKLLAEKVTEITGQSIDDYIVIDFRGFKDIVNALGGVEVNVPKDLIDREYPDENWGYEVFSVKAGLQTFDGDTALKYARSRHSTSDFDRSERQQILIKSIKDKALSIGFLTNPGKITDLFGAVSNHIDTSLNLGDIIALALNMKDVPSEHINVYSLSDACSGNKCEAGAYLYTPAREYFGGASVVIPENATASRLSSYEDIRRYSGFIFRFPEIRKELAPVSIIVPKGKSSRAKILAANLEKLGFNLDNRKSVIESTGALTTSHVNIYWNPDAKAGINPEGVIITALKFIEEKIPYSTVIHNEYVTTDGPRIEIVLGDDASSYFTFAKAAYYLPYIPSSSNTGEVSSGKISGSGTKTVSGETKKSPSPSKTTPTPTSKNTTPTNPKSNTPQTTPTPESPTIQAGQWEEF